jgi:hypothetical protein
VDKTPAPPICRLPEYESAVAKLTFELVHELMAARDPILANVRREETGHVSTGEVPNGVALGASWPLVLRLTFGASVEAMIDCGLDSWTTMISDAADEGLSMLMPQFFNGMAEACERAGTTIDFGGRPFDHDVYLDILEAYDLGFDDAGDPQLPAIAAGPALCERIRRLPSRTPAQNARYEAIIEKKRTQFNARRRFRTLD